jgi:outer membrane immunogenic protein
MRVKFVTLGSALALAALSSSAFAADMAAEAQAVHNWSGFYAGIVGGYSFGETSFYDAPTGDRSIPGDLTGVSGGVTLGYNVQSGSWVFGAEADISAADISGTSANNTGVFGCGGALCYADVTWLATVRGRVGYAFGSTMPFLTAGLAVGNAEGEYTNGFPNSDTLTGFTVGAGLEHAFSDKISAKLEYLYTDLGTLDVGPFCIGGQCKSDFVFSTVRVGLNYKF